MNYTLPKYFPKKFILPINFLFVKNFRKVKKFSKIDINYNIKKKKSFYNHNLDTGKLY